MIKISCEGATSLEVLSHIKGFALLISTEVPAKTGTMPEDIAAQAAVTTHLPVPSAPAQQQQTAPVVPMMPTPAAVPIAAPAPAPVPAAVPVATAPGYTLDQLGKAGAALVDAGKRDQLIALLQRRGIQTLSQLDPSQYGAFATELRGLGAQI